jgi:hypothetical protein
MVPAVSGGSERRVTWFSVFNGDDASIDLSVLFDDDGDSVTLWSGTVASGDTLEWSVDGGFRQKTIVVVTPAIAVDSVEAITPASGVDFNGLPIIDGVPTPNSGGSQILDLTGVATGEAIVNVKDNLASAFEVKQSTNSYLKVITTNGSEAVAVGQPLAPTQVQPAIGASTAAAGTTTADAGALPAGTAAVYPTTGADDAKGVRVHASDKVTGRMLFIGNGVANKILLVYPPTGGTINGAAADAAFSSASGKGVVMVCLSSGANTWLAW